MGSLLGRDKSLLLPPAPKTQGEVIEGPLGVYQSYLLTSQISSWLR